jgi:hypothetical protein
MKPKGKDPYWLSGGTEICQVCQQPYIYEMEHRCVTCDRGICPICAFMEPRTSEIFCPDCCSETPEE